MFKLYMFELKICIKSSHSQNILNIGFSHSIMTKLFTCFSFQRQMSPEKVSRTRVRVFNCYERRSCAFQVCKVPLYLNMYGDRLYSSFAPLIGVY